MIWLNLRPLSSGDWPFLYPETIKSFSFLPTVWSYLYSGMGNFNYNAGLGFFFELTSKILNKLTVPWFLIERLIWFWPFLFLALYSSWCLSKTLFPKEKLIHFLSPLIYLFNSYTLMLVGGGQMGIALAYSLVPLTLSLFLKLIKKPQIEKKLIFGLTMAGQLLLDARIFLLTIALVFFYFLFNFHFTLKRCFKFFYLPFLIILGMNFFWLWPSLTIKGGALPQSLQHSGWVSFLSFADFSDALGLLHPNWPENIFGKTYLMRPEFLIYPMLAFSSLIYGRRKILFFNLLALLGAFLAKGNQPPFGQIYLWFFKNLPGMNLFRDPTKFYLWVALAYSILIPYSLQKILMNTKLFKQ